jgi:5'-3' exoribonuclease 2
MDAKEADEKKAEFQTLLRRQQSNNGEENIETTMDDVIKKTWDSNVITPGTPFMFLLAQSIRYWIQWKLNTDPAWADLKVVISDASVPGEGEHKIMQFIRSQRSDPEYDPNTRHVMYGLDADLIMLGLGTHEPHFRILREDVFFQDAKAKTCKLCGQPGHYADQCRGNAKEKSGQFDEKASRPDSKPFIWLSVSVLREYLAAEMFVPGQSFRFDLERAIDDWVFMCFFVGNDFLPHLPSLDIHEDGIDKLIAIWRDNIPIMGGYLTCDGTVDLSRAQCILQGLAKQEDDIFRKRKEVEEKRERNQKRRQDQDQRRDSQGPKRRRGSPDYSQGARNVTAFDVSSLNVQVDYNMIVNRGAVDKALASNKSAAAALKAQMLANKNTETPTKNGVNGSVDTPPSNETPSSALGKRKSELADESDSGTPGRNTPVPVKEKKFAKLDPDDPPPDEVRLWETGYADRYYEQKFHVRTDDLEFRHKVARAYVEGLSWVLLYYFQGCPSWTWYYPYHYAPFAADFVDLDKMKVKFEKGKPFHPYEQLMGVFPAASKHAIPSAFHPLMTEEDSEIIDFYPEDFELDLNGKKQEWKAVVLLPFIDETRLLTAMGTKYPLLSDEERERNEFGSEALLLSDRNPLYDVLAMEFYSKKAKDVKKPLKLPMSKGRIAGTATKNRDFLPHMDLRGPEEDIKLEPPVDDDRSMNVDFAMPPSTHLHKSMLFPGVQMPPKALDNADLAILKSKARNSGRDFGGAPLYDNTRIDPMDRDRRGAGRINFAADRPPMGVVPPPIPPPGMGMPPIPPPGVSARDNPFAAFLDPSFAGKGMPMQGRVPPPPIPPPLQNYYGGQQQNQGGQNGYGGQRAPPSYGGYSNQDGGRNGGGNGYYGGHGQGQQGGRRDDNRSQGQNQGYGGYYGGQGGYARR